MKIAVISVTEKGARLAAKIVTARNADLFYKRAYEIPQGAVPYDSLQELTGKIFRAYDGLVFIMATGIVVRVIAPLIVHKAYDPAVVVINESGQHVISLLSGHIGGANKLTREIAQLIHAESVITTATDVNDCMAADLVAKELHLKITSFDMLRKINARLAAGENVPFLIDEQLPHTEIFQKEATKLDLSLKKVSASDIPPDKMYVFITEQEKKGALPQCLQLIPRRFIIGMGCRRGTTCENLLEYIQTTCFDLGLEIRYLSKLTSAVVKSDEPGLIELAAHLNVPIVFYENKELATVIESYHLDCSAFVKEQIGVGNVCEAAALLASRSKKILLRKQKFKNATIAIVWED